MMFEKGFPLYYRFQEVLKLKLVLYQHTKNLQEENRRLSELLEEQIPLNLLQLQPFAFQARPLDILPNLFEFGSIEIRSLRMGKHCPESFQRLGRNARAKNWDVSLQISLDEISTPTKTVFVISG